MGIDYGHKRVGIATADQDIGIAYPRGVLLNDADFWTNLKDAVTEHGVTVFVVGLPRNLDGDDTEQTKQARSFAAQLQQNLPGVPVFLQDEALTSLHAEASRQRLGKPAASKTALDDLSAAHILEDYLGVLRAE